LSCVERTCRGKEVFEWRSGKIAGKIKTEAKLSKTLKSVLKEWVTARPGSQLDVEVRGTEKGLLRFWLVQLNRGGNQGR
jgi:adenine C2-methylase RlmN of 23S rRNA A2503 and tRNA A37